MIDMKNAEKMPKYKRQRGDVCEMFQMKDVSLSDQKVKNVSKNTIIEIGLVL